MIAHIPVFPEGHFALLMKIKIMPCGLFELSRTMAYKTRNTVNRLYIELQKHTLNQITARNIRISLDKRIAFSKKSYGISEEKRTRANMIPVIRIYLYLAVLIIAGPGVTT